MDHFHLLCPTSTENAEVMRCGESVANPPPQDSSLYFLLPELQRQDLVDKVQYFHCPTTLFYGGECRTRSATIEPRALNRTTYVDPLPPACFIRMLIQIRSAHAGLSIAVGLASRTS